MNVTIFLKVGPTCLDFIYGSKRLKRKLPEVLAVEELTKLSISLGMSAQLSTSKPPARRLRSFGFSGTTKV